jgi:hypothetical protein
MKNLIKKCLFVTGILACTSVLFACVTQPSSGRPQWINSAASHQAVGSCATHALGKYKQKECAVSRARLELAARKGITISAQTVLTERATNLSSQSTLDGVTTQTVNSVIKTRLVDSYHDQQLDIIWVLIEEN